MMLRTFTYIIVPFLLLQLSPAVLVAQEQTNVTAAGTIDHERVILSSGLALLPTPKTSPRFETKHGFYYETASIFTIANSLTFPQYYYSSRVPTSLSGLSAERDRVINATFELFLPDNQNTEQFADLESIVRSLRARNLTQDGADIVNKINDEIRNNNNNHEKEEEAGSSQLPRAKNKSVSEIVNSVLLSSARGNDTRNGGKKTKVTGSLDFQVTWILHLVKRDTWAEYFRSHSDALEVADAGGDSLITLEGGEVAEKMVVAADAAAARDDASSVAADSGAAGSSSSKYPEFYPSVFPPKHYRTLCSKIPSLRSYVVGTLPGDLDSFLTWKDEKTRQQQGAAMKSPTTSAADSGSTSNTFPVTSSSLLSSTLTTTTPNNTPTTPVRITSPVTVQPSTTATTTTATSPPTSPASKKRPLGTRSLKRSVSFKVSDIRGDEFSLLLARCIWSTKLSDSYNKIATTNHSLTRPSSSSSSSSSSSLVANKLHEFKNLTDFVFYSKPIQAAAFVGVSYVISLPSGSKIGSTSLSLTATLRGQFFVELLSGAVYIVFGVAATLWLYLRAEFLVEAEEKRIRRLHKYHMFDRNHHVKTHRPTAEDLSILSAAAAEGRGGGSNRKSRSGSLVNSTENKFGGDMDETHNIMNRQNDNHHDHHHNDHDHDNINNHTATASSLVLLRNQQTMKYLSQIRRPPRYVFLACYSLVFRGATAVVSLLAAQASLAGDRQSWMEIVGEALSSIASMVDVFALLWLATGVSVTRRSITQVELAIWSLVIFGFFIIGFFASACATSRAPTDFIDSFIESSSSFGGTNCDTIFVVRNGFRIVAGLIVFLIVNYQESLVLTMLVEDDARSGYNRHRHRHRDHHLRHGAAAKPADSTDAAERRHHRVQEKQLTDDDALVFADEEMHSIDGAARNEINSKRKSKSPRHQRHHQHHHNDYLLPLCTVDTWLRLRGFKWPFLIVSLLPIWSAFGAQAYVAFGSDLWIMLLDKISAIILELMILYFFYDVAEHRK